MPDYTLFSPKQTVDDQRLTVKRRAICRELACDLPSFASRKTANGKPADSQAVANRRPSRRQTARARRQGMRRPQAGNGGNPAGAEARKRRGASPGRRRMECAFLVYTPPMQTIWTKRKRKGTAFSKKRYTFAASERRRRPPFPAYIMERIQGVTNALSSVFELRTFNRPMKTKAIP